ncbi:hypothetical protein B566_EDAN010000 [Ephemera danica]|nr:hypothetical protein B566_EDAN010000 [Ephemera danica]
MELPLSSSLLARRNSALDISGLQIPPPPAPLQPPRRRVSANDSSSHQPDHVKLKSPDPLLLLGGTPSPQHRTSPPYPGPQLPPKPSSMFPFTDIPPR